MFNHITFEPVIKMLHPYVQCTNPIHYKFPTSFFITFIPNIPQIKYIYVFENLINPNLPLFRHTVGIASLSLANGILMIVVVFVNRVNGPSVNSRNCPQKLA